MGGTRYVEKTYHIYKCLFDNNNLHVIVIVLLNMWIKHSLTCTVNFSIGRNKNDQSVLCKQTIFYFWHYRTLKNDAIINKWIIHFVEKYRFLTFLPNRQSCFKCRCINVYIYIYTKNVHVQKKCTKPLYLVGLLMI